MKALLIMNPGSRSGKGRRLWSFWESELHARGLAFDSVTTTGPGHGAALAAGAKDYDTVVAVGGDGTINEALDGVIQSRRSDLRLGVLYSGTSPDFCKYHRIPTSPKDAVAALAAGVSRRVDVGRIAYCAHNGESIVAHFGCGVNIGLGASVARVANGIRRFAGDFLGTCLAVVYSLAVTRPADIEATVDGSSLRLTAANHIGILKNPFMASGLHLDLDLPADNGQLVLFAIQGKSRFSALSVLPALYSGQAAKRPDVLIRRCSRMTVTCARKTGIEFDGDPRGFLPAEIEILPAALNLIGSCHERT